MARSARPLLLPVVAVFLVGCTTGIAPSPDPAASRGTAPSTRPSPTPTTLSESAKPTNDPNEPTPAAAEVGHWLDCRDGETVCDIAAMTQQKTRPATANGLLPRGPLPSVDPGQLSGSGQGARQAPVRRDAARHRTLSADSPSSRRPVSGRSSWCLSRQGVMPRIAPDTLAPPLCLFASSGRPGANGHGGRPSAIHGSLVGAVQLPRHHPL
jgi:hypothetical protein